MVEIVGSNTVLPDVYPDYIARLRNEHERLPVKEKLRFGQIQDVIHKYLDYVDRMIERRDELNISQGTKDLLKGNILPKNIIGVKIDESTTIELGHLDRKVEAKNGLVISYLDIKAIDTLMSDIVRSRPLTQLKAPTATSRFSAIFIKSLLRPKAGVK